MTKNNEWKLKDALMIAICAVLFGILLLGATYAGGILYGILAPAGMGSLGYEPFYGIYFMPAAFCIYIMRKPGTGMIAEILAAIIETLLGNFFGPIVILSGVVQGIGIELPIALKKYRDFGRPVMITSAVVCSVLTLIYNCFVSGYKMIALPILGVMLVVRIISAVFFCGILTPILGDRLSKAGVLRGYAICEEDAPA
ncbi:energy-coupling factor transport system substrate-specific component [[Clostridium] aminophilum]|uniref:Energy-coupling factor transport system substrate-specific component n=1 Tax=[Clostridium] aminophilum TaxID=1526 RepID=A0A1I0GDR9_9FIRM|nr:ECF transporter S component [[Clostridium] aminophilum]SET69194.1 energy-coupling factor transport system substrate-specific component [[Clostridium] aminophilum]